MSYLPNLKRKMDFSETSSQHTRNIRSYFSPAQGSSSQFSQNNAQNETSNKKRRIVNKSKQNNSYEALSQDEKLNLLIRKIDGFTSKSNDHEDRIVSIENENIGRDVKLNDLEQKFLNNKMEIAGLPIPNDITNDRSRWKKFALDYFASISISINSSDIYGVKLYNRKSKNGIAKIISITFSHEDIKNEIMRARRNKPPVFFAHVLTEANRRIISEAKKMIHQNIIQYVWTINGNVFMRDMKGKKSRIFHINQLFESSTNQEDNQEYDNDEDYADANDNIRENSPMDIQHTTNSIPTEVNQKVLLKPPTIQTMTGNHNMQTLQTIEANTLRIGHSQSSLPPHDTLPQVSTLPSISNIQSTSQ